MSESTLALTRTGLRQEIGYFLGYGRTASVWSTAEQADIDAILSKGLRQFYFPPRLSEDGTAHEWRFLKPVDGISTIASYTTGTVAITNGLTIVTLSDGIWPSWAYTHGSLNISETNYEIASRDSDTKLTLSAAWDEDTVTEQTYTLEHNGNYDLPDDFGGVEGDFTFEPAEGFSPIMVVGEGRIRALRQESDSRYRPRYVAVRPKESDGSSGQRFEAMFWPIPNSVYPLVYRKLVLANALTVSNSNPLGGMAHSQTILASCLAAAESQTEDRRGPKWDEYMTQLGASIEHDKKAYSQEYFGYNRDNSDGSEYKRTRVSGLVTHTSISEL